MGNFPHNEGLRVFSKIQIVPNLLLYNELTIYGAIGIQHALDQQIPN